MINRRLFAIATLLPAGGIYAQTTDGNVGKPIRLIVPYAAGGGADAMGRQIALQLSAQLGQPVYVDNKGGAGGSIGTSEAARAPGDGNTLALTTTAITAINPSVYRKLSYDVARDFVPVALVCDAPLVVVAHSNSPYKTLAEFINASKNSPGKIFFASSGNGTIAHMAVVQLNSKLRAGFTHVPFPAEAPALNAVLSGDQPMAYFSTLASALPLIKSGKLKSLGLPAPRRNKLLPEVTTFTEQGLNGVDVGFWYGVWAPKSISPVSLTRIEKALTTVMSRPDVQEKVEAAGFVPDVRGSAEFAKQIARDIEVYGGLAKSVGIQLD